MPPLQGCELKPGEMPAGWRSAGGVYKLQYTHPLCENSLAMVVAVCMGPVLVINGESRLTGTNLGSFILHILFIIIRKQKVRGIVLRKQNLLVLLCL